MTSHANYTDREREHAEERARRSHLTVTIALAAVAVLAYVLTVLLTAGRLPDTMATHFGVGGEPDQFMNTWSALLLQGAVVVLLPVGLLVTFGVASWWKGEYARTLSAIIVGTSVGLVALFVLLTLAHVGVTDPAQVRVTWQVWVISFGVGVAAALLVMFSVPAPLPRQAPTPVVPVEIAPNYRVSWFGKARMGQAFIVTLALAAAVVVLAAAASSIWWMWLVAIGMFLLIAALGSFDVIVDSRGVRWRGALGLPRGGVQLRDITDVSIIEVSPGDFGGFGVRLLPGRVGLITRSGRALRVVHGDRELVVTVDDAEQAAGVLEGWRRKARNRGA